MAVLNRIVKGEGSVASGASTSFPIVTPADPARTVVFGAVTTLSTQPQQALFSVRLDATGANVIFERATSGGPSTIGRYHLLEFTSGVSVQQVEVVHESNRPWGGSGVPITAVDPLSTFTVGSMRKGGGTYGQDDFSIHRLVSKDRIQTFPWQASSDGRSVFQVVEYDGMSVVLPGNPVFFGDSDTVRDLPWGGSLVNAAVLGSMNSENANPLGDIRQMLTTTHLTSGSNLRMQRAAGGTRAWHYPQLFIFSDGTTVQRGEQQFLQGDSSKSVLISTVNPNRSLAIAGGFQHSYGRSEYSAASIPGVAGFRLNVASSTSLTITRASTLGSAVCPWQVWTWV